MSSLIWNVIGCCDRCYHGFTGSIIAWGKLQGESGKPTFPASAIINAILAYSDRIDCDDLHLWKHIPVLDDYSILSYPRNFVDCSRSAGRYASDCLNAEFLFGWAAAGIGFTLQNRCWLSPSIGRTSGAIMSLHHNVKAWTGRSVSF